MTQEQNEAGDAPIKQELDDKVSKNHVGKDRFETRGGFFVGPNEKPNPFNLIDFFLKSLG